MFGLKLGQYVLSGVGNVNSIKFFGSGYSRDIPGPGFFIVSTKFVFCGEITSCMSETSNLVCKIFSPGQDQDQGLGPGFPRNVPKIPKFLKIFF